jgi:hypothetical protein
LHILEEPMLASNPQQRASLPTSLVPTWEPSEMAKIGKLGLS